MSEAARHHAINYVEFSTTDTATTKKFYTEAFGWRFQDWGSEYISWDKGQGGIDGGFRLREKGAETGLAAPLIVLYSKDLKASEDAVIAAGGTIVVPTFEFPGGRRSHFSDGAGNVLAVWSE
jgi:uncharacterized protein